MSESKFSAEQRQCLNEVLDEMIPKSADGRLPGAGEIDLAAAVERALEQNPGMRPAIDQGFAALAEVMSARGLETLAAASRAARTAMMKELESKEAGFVMTLMFVAYAAYYQNGRVLEALGLEGRPPHPKGYEMKGHDLSLLDVVRRRGKIFRHVVGDR